ncbi:N-acetylglucosamine kinase [Streptomyces sp. NPDC002143]
MTGTEGDRILLEGGGSRTWAALTRARAVLAVAEGCSTNPRSVGGERALAELVRLLAEIQRKTAVDAPPRVVIAAHGAASTARCADEFAGLLRTAVHRVGRAAAPVLVTNDIVPPLLSVDAGAPVCAVVAGTGTGFAVRNGPRWSRASGLEWLLSDEGGGHHLAVAGLRAAVRALDGRGAPTALTAAAREWCDPHPAPTVRVPLGEALFTAVYRDGAKPVVAEFARQVLSCADGGDPVAAGLVHAAADELVTGTLAALRTARVAPNAPYALVLNGSLFRPPDVLRRNFLERLAERAPWTSLHHGPDDRAESLLRLADVWAGAPHVLDDIAGAFPLRADPLPGSGLQRPDAAAVSG